MYSFLSLSLSLSLSLTHTIYHQMRCSACGKRGHMKTNKNCPMYKNNPVQVAPTDEEIAQHEASLSQDDLVKVEGVHSYSVRKLR